MPPGGGNWLTVRMIKVEKNCFAVKFLLVKDLEDCPLRY